MSTNFRTFDDEIEFHMGRVAREETMSEMEQLLEKVARECLHASGFNTADGVHTVLRRKLLPLLEAGEACKAHLEQYAGGPITVTNNHEIAKLAALKGDS